MDNIIEKRKNNDAYDKKLMDKINSNLLYLLQPSKRPLTQCNTHRKPLNTDTDEEISTLMSED